MSTERLGDPSRARRSLPVVHAAKGPSVLDSVLRLASPAPEEPEATGAGDGPWRASGYTIYVDLPDDPEAMLLVHAYSGAFDRVSRGVATYLRSLEDGPPPKPLYGAWAPEPPVEGRVPAPSDATIERLRRRGYLTRRTREEEQRYFARLAARMHHGALGRKPNYVLMPTYQCNLRCGYCFQDSMRTDPTKSHLLRAMTPEMVDRVFRGMDRIDAAHGLAPADRGPRSITLFGGEPLLAEHRAIVDRIFARARASGGAHVSAITNATELDAYADLLGPDGIRSVQITIDGPPAAHDRRRVHADGSGSFERIAGNVTLALDRGAEVSLRMNVDHANVDDLPVLAEEMVRRGWPRSPRFHAYVAAVHDSMDRVDDATILGTWRLRAKLAELAARVPDLRIVATQDAGMEQTIRRIFDRHADALPSFKTAFCGAHATMYVIDPFADVYACWERTGDPALRIGAIDEHGDVWTTEATYRAWRGRSVVSNPTCAQCRYATYCGGGCAALAEEQHGHMFGNHCASFGKRFRDSVATVYRDFVAGRATAVDGAVTCEA